MTDVFGPTEWIDPAYNLNPYGPAMVPGAMPTVAGGGPAPKSSGFGWGDLALPFLAGTAGLALGMRKPNITGPLYQLGALGSLLQMREQYGEQREEALRLRHQEMIERGARENADKGLPHAVEAGIREGLNMGFIDQTQARIIYQNTMERALEIQRNNQAMNQLMGLGPSAGAGAQVAGQPVQSMEFPAQQAGVQQADVQQAGGPVTALPPESAPTANVGTTRFLPEAFVDPSVTSAQITRDMVTGKGTFTVDLINQSVSKYVARQQALAAQMNQKVDMGDLYNRIKMSSQSQQVIDHVEKLHSGLFNATWSEMYKYTNGNPALAAVMALKATHWMPTQGHPAAQYLLQPSNVLGKLEMTRLLAQNVQAVRDSIQAGREVTNTINLDSIVKALSKSNFSITSEDMNEVVRGFSPIVAQTYNEYRSQGLTPLDAAKRTRLLFGGIPGSAEMEEVLKPATTAFQALQNQGVPPLEAERRIIYQRELDVPQRATPAQQEQALQQSSQIAQLEKIEQTAKLHPEWFGGKGGWRGKFRSWQAFLDSAPPGFADFQAQVDALFGAVGRAAAGAALTETELRVYLKSLPNIKSDSSQDFIAHVNITRDNLKNLYRRAAIIQAGQHILPTRLPEQQPSQAPVNEDRLRELHEGAHKKSKGLLPLP